MTVASQKGDAAAELCANSASELPEKANVSAVEVELYNNSSSVLVHQI